MSRLGQGINTEGAKEPQQSGLCVLADVESNVEIVDTTRGVEEVIFTHSARDAAYFGWSESAIASSRPLPLASAQDKSEGEISGITGSYMLCMCQISFKGTLKPHPMLENTVRDALGVPDHLERARRLAELVELAAQVDDLVAGAHERIREARVLGLQELHLACEVTVRLGHPGTPCRPPP